MEEMPQRTTTIKFETYQLLKPSDVSTSICTQYFNWCIRLNKEYKMSNNQQHIVQTQLDYGDKKKKKKTKKKYTYI